MAEVQTNTESGEMAQRFIEFVMMQAQNAALFLGQLPHPGGEGPEVNLDIAKMFIDQLVMIRTKTRGNLSTDEQSVLNNTISNLQMAFFEASQQKPGEANKPAATERTPVEAAASAEPAPASPGSAPESANAAETDESAGSKKKFTKSYGA